MLKAPFVPAPVVCPVVGSGFEANVFIGLDVPFTTVGSMMASCTSRYDATAERFSVTVVNMNESKSVVGAVGR